MENNNETARGVHQYLDILIHGAEESDLTVTHYEAIEEVAQVYLSSPEKFRLIRALLKNLLFRLF